MKTDNPLEEVTRRLDFLQHRFDSFNRLRRTGAMIDERVFQGMENNYTRGLEHLRTLRAYDELRAYTAWYKRYLSNGDPL